MIMYFIANTRSTGSSTVITLPSELKLDDGMTYQFSVESIPVSKDEEDD